MKTRFLILCVLVVMISVMILFFITNNVGGYSYIPLDCAIKEAFGYFSKDDSLNQLTGCFRGSHPAMLQ